MFCAGGIATPADASLVMQLGAQAVFVGSGIFKSEQPEVMAKAIVEATTHYADAAIVAKVSRGLGDAMRGAEIGELDVKLAGSRLVAALANCMSTSGLTTRGRSAAEAEPRRVPERRRSSLHSGGATAETPR